MELKIFDLHADLENSEIHIINKCLSIFLESYGQIFNAIGEKIQIEPILSARWMLVLCENDNLVGFSILRPHQLKIESWLDTKYFSALSVETKNNLTQAKKTLSIEWVTVHPAHQKKFSKNWIERRFSKRLFYPNFPILIRFALFCCIFKIS